MATGGNGDDPQMILHSEVQLMMLSEGSFRLRPCRYCGNSDPRLIELEEDQVRDGGTEERGEAGNGDAADTARPMHRLKCKKCNNPYTLSTSPVEVLPSLIDGDGDYGLGLAGVECCKCGNAIPDCFSVCRYDNGRLQSITCLVCHHGNTFHEPDAAAAGVGSPSNDASEAESSASFTAAIECIKCHNSDENLFEVTFHPDGRVHKVTCKVCKHGNTFRNQSEQASATSWFSWNAVSSAAQALAMPVWSAGQSLVQMSLQVSNTIQNNGPLTDGLRDMAAGQVASLGKNLVLGLGDKYLKMLLPMIPNKTRQAVTRNLSEAISQCAMKLLSARKEKKDSTANAAIMPANTKDPAEDKPPTDDDSSLGAI